MTPPRTRLLSNLTNLNLSSPFFPLHVDNTSYASSKIIRLLSMISGPFLTGHCQGGVSRNCKKEVIRSPDQQSAELLRGSVRQAVGQSQGLPGGGQLRHPAQVQVPLRSPHLPGQDQAQQHHLPPRPGQQPGQHGQQDQDTEGED